MGLYWDVRGRGPGGSDSSPTDNGSHARWEEIKNERNQGDEKLSFSMDDGEATKGGKNKGRNLRVGEVEIQTFSPKRGGGAAIEDSSWQAQAGMR